MKKWMLVTLFLTTPALATIRPVASVGVGLDFAYFHQNQNIILVQPYTNTYASTGSANEVMGNLFLGLESPIYQNIFGQLGFSYYQTYQLLVTGTVYQFASPSLDNLTYAFKINSRRLMVEGKLLSTLDTHFHPYLSLGLGQATNTSYSYQEQPVTSADVPMAYTFASKTYRSLTYAVGIGMDYDVTPNVRVGGGYRFSDIGKAGLGTIPAQSSTTTLKYNNQKLNEFLFQLTYLS